MSDFRYQKNCLLRVVHVRVRFVDFHHRRLVGTHNKVVVRRSDLSVEVLKSYLEAVLEKRFQGEDWNFQVKLVALGCCVHQIREVRT